MMLYLLFGGEIYYANGGGNDFIKASDNLEELNTYAHSLIEAEDIEWFHIFDTEKLSIIEESKIKPFETGKEKFE